VVVVVTVVVVVELLVLVLVTAAATVLATLMAVGPLPCGPCSEGEGWVWGGALACAWGEGRPWVLSLPRLPPRVRVCACVCHLFVLVVFHTPRLVLVVCVLVSLFLCVLVRLPVPLLLLVSCFCAPDGPALPHDPADAGNCTWLRVCTCAVCAGDPDLLAGGCVAGLLCVGHCSAGSSVPNWSSLAADFVHQTWAGRHGTAGSWAPAVFVDGRG